MWLAAGGVTGTCRAVLAWVGRAFVRFFGAASDEGRTGLAAPSLAVGTLGGGDGSRVVLDWRRLEERIEPRANDIEAALARGIGGVMGLGFWASTAQHSETKSCSCCCFCSDSAGGVGLCRRCRYRCLDDEEGDEMTLFILLSIINSSSLKLCEVYAGAIVVASFATHTQKQERRTKKIMTKLPLDSMAHSPHTHLSIYPEIPTTPLSNKYVPIFIPLPANLPPHQPTHPPNHHPSMVTQHFLQVQRQ